MIEKLTSLVLNEKEKITAKVIDVLLWVALVTVSYTIYLGDLSTEAKDILSFFYTGKFLLFFAWSTCVVLSYGIIKFLLTRVLTTTKLAMHFFLKNLVPEEYKISILNVYYRKALHASTRYFEKAIEYSNQEGMNLPEAQKSLNLATGILLKFTLLLLISLMHISGKPFAVTLVATIICFGLLAYLLAGLTSVKGKQVIHSILQKIPNTFNQNT